MTQTCNAKLKTTLLALALAGLSLGAAGCSTEDTGSFVGGGFFPSSTVNPATPTGTLLLRSTLAKAVPKGVQSFRITGFATGGAVVFGPRIEAKAAEIPLTVPITMKEVLIEYLVGNSVVGRYRQPVNVPEGGTVTINDPDFTTSGAIVNVVGRMEANVNATWAAYQDGPNGTWHRLDPGATGYYGVPVSDPQGRYSIAIISSVQEGQGGEEPATTKVIIAHTTMNEAPELVLKTELETDATGGGGAGGGGEQQAKAGPGITVSGQVLGLNGGDGGRAHMDMGLYADLTGSTFSITGLVPGLHPIVALKGPGYPGMGMTLEGGGYPPANNGAIDTIFMGRLNISGTSDVTFDIDFNNTAVAKPAVSADVTLTGVPGGDTVEAGVDIATVRETHVPVSTQEGNVVHYKGYPFPTEEEEGGGGPGGAPATIEGVHLFTALSTGAEDLTNGTPFRSVQSFFLTPTNREESLLAAGLGPVTVSATQATFPAFEGAQAYVLQYADSLTDASTSWRIAASPGWLAGGTQLSVPNLGGVDGFQSSWNFPATSFWSVAASIGQNLTLGQLLGGFGEGADGMVLKQAGRSGSLVAPL